MKKLTKVLALLLCMLMVLSLCGCGKTDQEKIIGTWEAEADMTDELKASFEETMGENAGYFDFDNITATVTYVFNEDGTCSFDVEITDESIEELNNAFLEAFTKFLEDSFEEQAAAMGMTMEEFEAAYYAETGTLLADDMQAFIDGEMGEIDFESQFEDMHKDGKWKIEEGKLFITENMDSDFNDGDYIVYKNLGDDSFVLVCKYTDGEKTDSPFENLTFSKIG